MQPKTHAKAIKGLAIAVVVLSALAIVFSIVGMGVMSILGTIIDSVDPYGSHTGTFGYYYDDYYSDLYGYPLSDSYYSDGLEYALIMFGTIAMLIWAVACSIVTLISGIIALRFYNNPQKLGLVMVWAIIGAIVGFLATGIVMAVLLIIIAVFANKDKKLYMYGYTAPAYAVNPQNPPMQTPPVAYPQNTSVAPVNASAPTAVPVAAPAGTVSVPVNVANAPTQTPSVTTPVSEHSVQPVNSIVTLPPEIVSGTSTQVTPSSSTSTAEVAETTSTPSADAANDAEAAKVVEVAESTISSDAAQAMNSENEAAPVIVEVTEEATEAVIENASNASADQSESSANNAGEGSANESQNS